MNRIISDIFNSAWLIQKSTVDSMLPWIINVIDGKIDLKFPMTMQRPGNSVLRIIEATSNRYELEESDYDPKNVPEGTIAIIPITGVITKYDQPCGPVGTQTIIKTLERLDSDPNVEFIILKIDSPGGEGYAALNLSDAIRGMKTSSYAFVDDMACSAAYWIASAAQEVYANTKMAIVGSIGTYITILDYREKFAKEGIKITEVYAKDSVDKNLSYREAIDGRTKLVQEKVSIFNDQFINSVCINRGDNLKQDIPVWGTGKDFLASEALKIGLIDHIMPFKQMIDDIIVNH